MAQCGAVIREMHLVELYYANARLNLKQEGYRQIIEALFGCFWESFINRICPVSFLQKFPNILIQLAAGEALPDDAKGVSGDKERF